jgi:D-xylose transport system substrate-binding protein
MKAKQSILLMLLALLACCLLAGCGHDKAEAENTGDLRKLELADFRNNKVDLKGVIGSQGRKVLIGVSLDTLKEPVWKLQRDSLVAVAKQSDADIRVMQANSDDQVQLSQIDQLIAEGVDVLIIAPHDAKMLTGVAEKAHAAGVKVIAYDRMISGSDIDFYIGIDNEKVGQLQAQTVLDKAKSGKVVYIGGAETDPNAILFHAGAMKTLAKSPSMQVVADSYTPNWSSEIAYNSALAALEANGDVKAMLCANDGTAMGALAAIEKMGIKPESIVITGLDAELAACQRIVEDKQTMTVYKQPVKLSQEAVKTAIALAKGEQAEKTGDMNNGFKNVPVYLVDPVAVTKDNMMDTIIKDNYYTLDDVYKNIPQGQRPSR